MLNIIPADIYTAIFYYIILLFVLLTFIHTQIRKLGSNANKSFKAGTGLLLLIFVVFYIGFRPIDIVFNDMLSYYSMFKKYAMGYEITSNVDLPFHLFTKYSSQIMTAEMFFFVCACIYVIPLYLVSKKWFKQNWFYSFIFLVSAFSFWAYGTNTIRNGLAGSIFLLGISRDKKLWKILFIALAIAFHKTMLLPTLAYLVSSFYNKPKIYIFIWFACIALYLTFGDFFKNFVGVLDLDESRMVYFTAEVEEGKFSRTGFRWDFLLYSSIGVFAGWYYTFKKKFNDKNYSLLFNTFLISNSFWVLVNTAIFSDRFAYLSWFLMPLLIIYPLLITKLFSSQHKIIGFLLLLYFGFTFFMFIK